jgi:hypothetical protein
MKNLESAMAPSLKCPLSASESRWKNEKTLKSELGYNNIFLTMKNNLGKNWSLGFLGFMAFYGLTYFQTHELMSLIWFVWVVWFIWFLPINKK